MILVTACELYAREGPVPKWTWRSALACFDATSPVFENGHTVPAIETLEKLARRWKFP